MGAPQIQRERYLLTVYKLVDGDTNQGALGDDVLKSLGMEADEANKIAQYLKDEGLLKFRTFSSIALTHPGLKEVERLHSLPYNEVAARVLWAISELCHGSLSKLVLIEHIAQYLLMSFHDVSPVLDDLDERRGYIQALNEAVLLLPAGKQALDEMKKPKTTEKVSSDVFITHVHGDNFGAVQVGHGNTQSVVTHQSMTDILPKLAEFIEVVKKQDFEDKEDVVKDLEQAHKLAQGEVNEGVWRRIQAKLTAAKTTMEVAGLVYKNISLLASSLGLLQ